MDNIVYSEAPGKVLWLGGYSVLERPNVGLVTGVDAHVRARAVSSTNDEVRLTIPQFSVDIKGRIDLSSGSIILDESPQLRLVRTAMELATKYAKGIGVNPTGFSLLTENDPAMMYNRMAGGRISKSGLGSSAAVIVATISAVLTLFEVDLKENDALHKLAQLSHSVATGKVGSGFDVAAAVYGSSVYTRYSPAMVETFPKDYGADDVVASVRKNWDFSIKKVELPPIFDTAFASFVNDSAITVSLVNGVRKFKAANPDTYTEVISKMNAANLSAVDALTRLSNGEKAQDSLSEFRQAFEEGRNQTKLLGKLSGIEIEPDSATKLIKESEHHGAFVAKLPGAGGMDSIAALSFSGQPAENLRAFWSSRSELQLLNIRSTNEGYSVSFNKKELPRKLYA